MFLARYANVPLEAVLPREAFAEGGLSPAWTGAIAKVTNRLLKAEREEREAHTKAIMRASSRL